MSRVECNSVQKLMSPFIDSMVTPKETERVESHLALCEPCQRLLQSYISMRSLVAGAEAPPPPEDMVRETRVLLSYALNTNLLVRLENRLNNILNPMLLP